MIPVLSHTCICGRKLQSAGALTKHEKLCTKGRKRLADALGKAREVYQRKKRRSTAADLGHDDSISPHADARSANVDNQGAVQVVSSVSSHECPNFLPCSCNVPISLMHNRWRMVTDSSVLIVLQHGEHGD